MNEFWKQSRTFYPSVFRILIGIVLLLDLAFSYTSGRFLYDSELVAYQSSTADLLILILRENYGVFYVSYGLVLFMFILGIGKNFVSLLVCIFHFTYLLLSPYTINWGDVILKYTLLYFVFVDSFRHFTIGKKSLFEQGKIDFVSQLAVWSILLHLFLVYLSNAVYKLSDHDWLQGFAAFYGFSQFPGFENSKFYPLLSNELLGKIISYFIILQQLTFIPLVFWSKTRFWAIAVGIIIHLTMFYQFGLWKFETIIILLYGFLLNDAEWEKLMKILKFRNFNLLK